MDKSRFFESDGQGAFLEMSEAAGLADNERGYAIACADFDNDGDTDIFQTHRNASNAGTLGETIPAAATCAWNSMACRPTRRPRARVSG